MPNVTSTGSGFRLSHSSLDWALTHVERFGDTDIFPLPFEFAAIRHRWAYVRDWLASQDLFTWAIRPHRRCLSPKHRFGFRLSTQLDPFDTLIYAALVHDLGAHIEAARLPAKAQIVHSHRFKPDASGQLFDHDYSYESFRVRSDELANAGNCAAVVVADIADFYPRVYLHPLENALAACTGGSDAAKVVVRLIKQWNASVSYGIPVGPSASRLLAELTISDVDAALRSEDLVFCRYVDDYRIFCGNERAAYEALAFLAKTLFDYHGLTLQQHKTEILSLDAFNDVNRRTERDEERRSLTARFEDILDSLGVEGWYDPIEYDDLREELQEQVDRMNLQGLLEEQLDASREFDAAITRFALRRLAQLGDPSAVDTVLGEGSIVRLYPVFKDVMVYLRSVRRIDATRRRQIGMRLLDLIGGSVVGHLEYHRSWILSLFTYDREWDNEDRFIAILHEYPDRFTQREAISALGRARQAYWFKAAKRDFQQLGPWERRAFLAAATCLPGDEGRFWHRSVGRQLDELEGAVVAWAEANPY